MLEAEKDVITLELEHRRVYGRMDGKTVIVTGASSGFGEAIALACAEAGANVSLIARRRELLESVADAARALNGGGQALVCPADSAMTGRLMRRWSRRGPR